MCVCVCVFAVPLFRRFVRLFVCLAVSFFFPPGDPTLISPSRFTVRFCFRVFLRTQSRQGHRGCDKSFLQERGAFFIVFFS